jgi:hypothetical protein
LSERGHTEAGQWDQAKMQKRKTSADEQIGGILDRTAQVRESLGAFWGPLVMMWALWVARRKTHWILGLVSAIFGAKWAGLV